MDEHPYLNETSEVESEDYELRDYLTLTDIVVAGHGVTTTVLCPIGILTNIVNMVVLTRKNMSRSPTNVILTSMAVADLLYLISVLIHNLFFLNIIGLDERVYLSLEVRVLLVSTFQCAQTTSRISLVLTFISALWRYLAVTFPLKVRQWCSLKRTYVAIVFSYVFVPLTMIGRYLSTTFCSVDFVVTVNNSLIDVGPTPTTYDCTPLQDWEIYGLPPFDGYALMLNSYRVFKVLYNVLLPIVVLVISIILIRSLYVSHRQHSELAQNSVTLNRSGLRTTKMLVAVLLLFFITEIPRGVAFIINEVPDLFIDPSLKFMLTELHELLDILNSSLNFVIYVTMSTQIRKNFLNLIAPCVCKRKVPHAPSQNVTCTTHL